MKIGHLKVIYFIVHSGADPLTLPEWPQTSTSRHQTEGGIVQQLFVVVPTDDSVKMGIINIYTLNSLVCFGIWTITYSYWTFVM